MVHKEKSINDLVYNELILVVDDSRTCLTMITALYKRAGFTNVVVAQDGREAIDLTLSHRPSLVVLDISMPVLDGIEYCKIIRQEEEFLTMPIIVQSATTDAEEISLAFNAGANDFISKPPSASELISRTRVHLSKKILERSLSEYKERMGADLKIARRMQASIIPNDELVQQFKDAYACDIGSIFEPSAELGGDFWGMRPLSDKLLALYNIDLSGHGVSAALNTFRLHAILNEKKEYFDEPDQCLECISSRLNLLLDVGQYATAFYGVVNVEQNTLKYVLAGAPAPIILNDEKSSVRILEGRGIPVGAIKNIEYEMYEVKFVPNETLISYSDALIETSNDHGEFFTEEDIIKSFSDSYGLDAQGRVDKLLKDFHDFIGEANEISDDLTIVTLTRRV